MHVQFSVRTADKRDGSNFSMTYCSSSPSPPRLKSLLSKPPPITNRPVASESSKPKLAKITIPERNPALPPPYAKRPMPFSSGCPRPIFRTHIEQIQLSPKTDTAPQTSLNTSSIATLPTRPLPKEPQGEPTPDLGLGTVKFVGNVKVFQVDVRPLNVVPKKQRSGSAEP
ncbi:hypothetical protein CC1G_09196 [Coprinopsis cinerea okayama7|uniref:Uncharacterized protein n=1 Tax=Coprinopsis cinerea (strain Okayama-7 / 130 / ATCC MYA-4618 / FGSC 9003) TaxID=240176 RepID=A8P9X4_COPC7|nr:hypothetical protein CC1G_09196 [Coprinopsis cinerea okayama7\|eukprot:XP_001839862.1 hypothetical protein CC1G_09196 [Coprinopsis cinerea okayama7\